MHKSGKVGPLCVIQNLSSKIPFPWFFVDVVVVGGVLVLVGVDDVLPEHW